MILFGYVVEIEKDELIDIQWTAKKKVAMILVVIMGIAIYVLLIWGERYIEQNEIIKRILAIFTVIFLLIDYVKNRFKKRENENEPIFVDITQRYMFRVLLWHGGICSEPIIKEAFVREGDQAAKLAKMNEN